MVILVQPVSLVLLARFLDLQVILALLVPQASAVQLAAPALAALPDTLVHRALLVQLDPLAQLELPDALDQLAPHQR